MSKEVHDFPIDVVIPWVEGSDPKHLEKRALYQKKPEKGANWAGLLNWRFVEVGEVKYAIYSIRRFAPWVRNIYLVTDDQCPDWLDNNKQKELNVQVIDHRVIFRDHLNALPTFNSISISTLFWKIPGISNHYISMDDDFFFVNSNYPEDFFINGRQVVRGYWTPHIPKAFNMVKSLWRHLFIRRNFKNFHLTQHNNPHSRSGRTLGFKKTFFQPVHSPYTWRVDLQERYYTENPQLLSDSVSYRFRSKYQVEPISMASHLAIKNGLAIESKGDDCLLIIPDKEGLTNHKDRFNRIVERDDSIKVLCFQDLAYLRKVNPDAFNKAIDILNSIILE